ncbi:MAG: preprotein translocase subunit SecA [Dehalococcoidales bacterium]|nr:preprotein translocase subunit SecA [Dehalococcoidales bacterium]
MFKWLGNLIDSNEKVLKKMQPTIAQINSFEPEYEKLSDDELKAKTQEFKDRVAKAVTDIQQRVDATHQELQDAKKGLAEAQDDYARENWEENTKQLQEKLEQLEKELWKAQNDALDELLHEAFAAVREAARRTIKQRPYDVQLMGGIVLHQGRIAEMKTGEGKTLVATLPLYLNSLTGKGAHLVTVNDYLSKRDPYWMAPIYHALGVSVSSIQGQQTAGAQGGVSFIYDPGFDSGKENDPWCHFRPVTRKEAYQADITYGTNNEFGFDYLRDNMVVDLKQCTQRELNYAIVDEVDNILIDEARTPLIISGPAEEGALRKYSLVDKVARQLNGKIVTDKEETEAKQKNIDIESGLDYLVDEKNHSVRLTGDGVGKAQNKLAIESLNEFQLKWEHYIRQAIIANVLYKKNKEYVINNGKVVIVDEFTGRMMHGRRYSDGLHQAIEAKELANGERVRIEEESRTYATVTFQNYFRMYQKLAGMTGTAVTEAEEFHKIYKLEVVVIPTNKPAKRQDATDKIYKNEEAKFRQVVTEVEELHKQGRPILIGTVSVEKSEVLSDMMKRKGISPQVLNAKYHEKEAAIVAQAGRLGAITVATNMAGRGVDIILGGNPEGRNPDEWQKEHDEVIDKGGLHIIGTERHEARRIDNQLRGRAGRQGDPGSTRFYVSLEDDIMRRFGGDRVRTVMEMMHIGEDVPIENSIVNKAIESAQVRVEGYHFDVRKHLVDYDDVVNNQRKIIYGERRKILSGADLRANIFSMIKEEMADIIAAHTGENSDGNLTQLVSEVKTIMPLPAGFNAESVAGMKPNEIDEQLMRQAEALYQKRESELGADSMRMLERLLMLRVIDNYWVEHLTNMDNMRQGVGLHAIAQRDPLAVYKNQGHELFDNMMAGIRHDLVHNIFNLNITKGPPPKQTASPMAKVAVASRGSDRAQPAEKVAGKKIGRNDPCPCGSGKKYKHCCGKQS